MAGRCLNGLDEAGTALHAVLHSAGDGHGGRSPADGVVPNLRGEWGRRVEHVPREGLLGLMEGQGCGHLPLPLQVVLIGLDEEGGVMPAEGGWGGGLQGGQLVDGACGGLWGALEERTHIGDPYTTGARSQDFAFTFSSLHCN